MNIEYIQKIRNYLDTVDLGEFPNVHGVLFDYKKVGNNTTNELSLVYAVHSKKSLSVLKEEEVIPKQITFDDITLSTDVVEMAACSALPCVNPDTRSFPLSVHYAVTRPLKGGVSCIAAGSTDATLGLLCIDKLDGKIVGLTNNHVANISPMIFSSQLEYGNNGFNINIQQPATSAYNPFGANYKTNDQIKNFIGKMKRTYPYHTTGSLNKVDCAVIELSSYDLIDSSSVDVVNFSEKGPYKWATTEELDSLFVVGHLNYASPLFRSGRTLGAFGYPGSSSSCKISAYSFGNLGVTTLISNQYIKLLNFGNASSVGPGRIAYSTYTFNDSISIRCNVDELPADGGDSGSACFALLSSTVQSASAWKLIGLVFAGNSTDKIGVVCRIDNIAKALNVAPWNGQIPSNYSSKNKYAVEKTTRFNSTTNYSDTSGNTYKFNNFDNATPTVSGQKYFHNGFAIFDPNLLPPCTFSIVGMVSSEYNIGRIP